MRFKKDKNGRWYRELEFSGEDKPTYQRVDPKTEARLREEFGDREGIVDLTGEIKGISKEGLKGVIRDTLGDIITDDILQKEKDRMSLDMQKEGGGVVRLDSRNPYQRDSEDRGEKQKVISELYKKAKRGDEDAKQKLDGLWKLTIPKLRELERSGSLIVVGCPKCNTGIDPDLSECPVCGWSKYDAGYAKSFNDIMSRGKR